MSTNLNIKQNDWFVVTNVEELLGENNAMKEVRESGRPLRVYQVHTKSVFDKKAPVSITASDPYMNVAANNMWSIENVQVITANEAARLQGEISAKIAAEAEKKMQHMLKEADIPWKERRVYNITEKADINSNVNYVQVGQFNEDGTPKAISRIVSNFGGACCSFTKTTESLLVYIPTFWAKYYGYNEDFVKEYIDFLRGIDKSFETITYVGRGTCPDFIPHTGTFRKGNFYIPTNDFFKVRIQGSSSRMTTYFHFITVRYLYNLQYCNIPHTAMHIKNAMGDRISNMHAMLLAHYREWYNDYYCWVSHVNNGSQYSSFIPVFSANLTYLLSKINAGTHSMNSAFTYVSTDCSRRLQVMKLLKENKWEEAVVLMAKIENHTLPEKKEEVSAQELEPEMKVVVKKKAAKKPVAKKAAKSSTTTVKKRVTKQAKLFE